MRKKAKIKIERALQIQKRIMASKFQNTVKLIWAGHLVELYKNMTRENFKKARNIVSEITAIENCKSLFMENKPTLYFSSDKGGVAGNVSTWVGIPDSAMESFKIHAVAALDE